MLSRITRPTRLPHLAPRRTLTSSSSSPGGTTPLPTPLKARHEALNGKLVEFAGYSLPVLYEKFGVLKEHLHTRESASLFDVSHMGQVKIRGRDRVAFLEKLVVADVKGLKPGESTLTVFTNEKGGIIDDAIVTNAGGDHLHVVVNGACKDKDLAHLRRHLPKSGGIELEMLSDKTTTLMALQGPKAAQVLAPLLPRSFDLAKMNFMTCVEEIEVAGYKCRLSRCGYTGEDGFEISVNDNGVRVFDKLFESAPDVLRPAGLGARDSLRLEAGLCLYGHDLSEDITPVEAALNWVVGKRRREGSDANFLGASKILSQLKNPGEVRRKRVGFTVEGGGAPAREHAVISHQGKPVGEVTSGTFSPSLRKPIGMAYVEAAHAKVGTELEVEVRGKKNKIVISKMPFVPTRYYRVP